MSQSSIRDRALYGLQQGLISQEEYNRFIQELDRTNNITIVQELQEKESPKLEIPVSEIKKENIPQQNIHQYNNNNKTTNKNIISTNKNIIFAALFLIAITGIFWSIASSNNGLVGFATLDVPVQNYTGNMTIHATQEFTSLKISGTLYGDGTANIYYKTNDSNLLIGTITSDDSTPRTTKASYAAEEEVTIDNLPSLYNAYLDDGITNAQTTIPFAAPNQSMTLLIVANDSDNLTTYRLPIIIGNIDRTTTFANLCVDTCNMPAALGDIVIETTGTTQLTFTNIETTLPQNNPPTLVVPFNAITVNETTTINLTEHFIDIDGDTLYYSTENSNIATLTTENNVLTITPLQDGTQTITIYASDLKEIAIGTIDLTVTGMTLPIVTTNNTTNETLNNNSINTTEINTTIVNNTMNNTINKINNTINSTVDINTIIETNTTQNATTNLTQNTTIDCSNPDPNARPLECIIESTYFKPEAIYIENKDADRVAMLTPIGNMLIKGDLVEHSTASPAANDYQLGYRNVDNNFVPTIWINTATGDLHLRGTLVEQNGQLPYREGYTSYTNQRGIILALANLENGDLILRGGIIPYRRVIE